MTPQVSDRTARTRCPGCGFEVEIADDCALCGHSLDEAANPE